MRCRFAVVVILISLWLAGAGRAFAQAGGDGQTTIHVVQRGETLFRIALSYGTSVEALAQTNGISDATNIQVGQRLIIPSGLVNASVPTAERHVIQPGETLAHIALRYGSTESIVAAINNIVNPSLIYVGQVLDVSERAPGRPLLSRGYTHTVSATDTLYRIALGYGATLESIMSANDLGLPTAIFPGQQLLIPGPEDAPALRSLPAPLTEVRITPLPLKVGSSFAIHVMTNQALTITGSFIDRDITFASGPDGLSHTGLGAIYALSTPGQYPLTLTLQAPAGEPTTYTVTLRVQDGGYGRENITLPADRTDLLDATASAADHQILLSVMSAFTPERHFDGPFGLPAAAPVTSRFGTRRSYNGSEYDRFHSGTDFGGPPGAAIYAPADGRVVMVDTLTVYGLFTAIDHGWGVYTGYAHQSESLVSVGQFVTAGEVIGRIGDTGRSAGPHLHWEFWVNGVETDGMQWTRTDFSIAPDVFAAED